MARFIDPRVDWAFKRIFGSEDTKECLITFLNGLFEDELVILSLLVAAATFLFLQVHIISTLMISQVLMPLLK